MADNISGKLAYFCNSNTSEVLIDMGRQENVGKIAGFKKHVVNVDDLLIVKKNKYGRLYKYGSKVDERGCGKITVRVESGYVNADPNGQSGADDFPVIELRMLSRTILPRTAMGLCSVNDRMSNYFFGKCPDFWASKIETKLTNFDSINIKVTRKFEDNALNEKEVASEVVIN